MRCSSFLESTTCTSPPAPSRPAHPPSPTQRPTTRVALDEEAAGKLLRLIDTLEDSDDVNEVHANFEVDEEILERVAG